jgi:hypothetical protein
VRCGRLQHPVQYSCIFWYLSRWMLTDVFQPRALWNGVFTLTPQLSSNFESLTSEGRIGVDFA